MKATREHSFGERPTVVPADEPRAALGRRFFFDAAFSANGKIACATCHDPRRDFTDGRPTAVGIGATERNTPSIINTFASDWFFWDGRADSLAQQALGPIEAANEHGFSRGEVAALIFEKYRVDYEQVFGPFPEALAHHLAGLTSAEERRLLGTSPERELPIPVAIYAVATVDSFHAQSDLTGRAASLGVSPQRLLAKEALASEPGDQAAAARYGALPAEVRRGVDEVFARFGEALAAYEKTVVAIDAPFDAFAARLVQTSSPADALTEGFGEVELEGYRLFLAHGCADCHSGPVFSDQQFHNIGLEARSAAFDLGRARGLILAKSDPFNCRGDLLPETSRESCLELAYLDEGSFENVGAFKTPSLRNVARTAPYMHDGRFGSLDEVLDHYSELATEPAVGHRTETLKPLGLRDDEREALKRFLESLTAPVIDLTAAGK